MERRKQLGNTSEQLAAQFLNSKGCTILQHNFSCRWGEIDLIAEQADTLVFVEVRSRTGEQYGKPLETVNWQKQQKIRKAAQYYLLQHPQRAEQYCRFDVISVLWKDGKATLDWLPDAFS